MTHRSGPTRLIVINADALDVIFFRAAVYAARSAYGAPKLRTGQRNIIVIYSSLQLAAVASPVMTFVAYHVVAELGTGDLYPADPRVRAGRYRVSDSPGKTVIYNVARLPRSLFRSLPHLRTFHGAILRVILRHYISFPIDTISTSEDAVINRAMSTVSR